MGCEEIFPKYALKYNLIKNTKDVRCVVQIKGGNIVTCGGDGKFYIWAKHCANTIDVIKGHFGCINAILLIKDDWLLSCGKDNKINLWDIENKFECKDNVTLQSEGFKLVKISSDKFALGSKTGIKVYKCNPFIQMYSIVLGNICDSLTLLKDGRLAANSIYKIALWNYSKKKEGLEYLEGHEKSVRSLLDLKNGTIASGGEDKKIMIWNISKKFREHELEGHKGGILSLFRLSTGNLISGDEFCLIYIWSIDYTCVEQTLIQEGSILDFYQLKDSMSFASVSSASEVKIWA